MSTILTACAAGTIAGLVLGWLGARWAWSVASGETNRRPR